MEMLNGNEKKGDLAENNNNTMYRLYLNPNDIEIG